MFSRRSRQQQNYGVYLLAYQLLSSDYIPPVTLGAILFQVAVFLGFIPAVDRWKITEMCLLPSQVLNQWEWMRLLASTVMHADDMHLYYNMVSLLWKGIRLEPLLGSRRFLLLLLLFSVSTSVCVVAMSYIIEIVLGFQGLQLMHQCAVGFSGVIFALKVLHNSYFPYGDAFIFGWFPVPSRYTCWVELFIIQLVTPNASLIGHLAGIVVGLLYINGPLSIVIDFIETILGIVLGLGYNDHNNTTSSQRRNSNFWRSGTTRENTGDYSEFTAGMSEEEQLRFAREESLRYGYRSTPTAPPYPLDDYFEQR